MHNSPQTARLLANQKNFRLSKEVLLIIDQPNFVAVALLREFPASAAFIQAGVGTTGKNLRLSSAIRASGIGVQQPRCPCKPTRKGHLSFALPWTNTNLLAARKWFSFRLLVQQLAKTRSSE